MCPEVVDCLRNMQLGRDHACQHVGRKCVVWLIVWARQYRNNTSDLSTSRPKLRQVARGPTASTLARADRCTPARSPRLRRRSHRRFRVWSSVTLRCGVAHHDAEPADHEPGMKVQVSVKQPVAVRLPARKPSSPGPWRRRTTPRCSRRSARRCPRWRIGRWATAPSPQAAGDEAVAGFRALGAARLLQRFQAEWA